jgi:hypothetical protein
VIIPDLSKDPALAPYSHLASGMGVRAMQATAASPFRFQSACARWQNGSRPRPRTCRGRR